MKLARGADHLLIEAVFTDADSDRARATEHLTARSAGEIAHAAGARRVIGFHHSARFDGSSDGISTEFAAALDPQAPPEGVEERDIQNEEPDWVEQWRRHWPFDQKCPRPL